MRFAVSIPQRFADGTFDPVRLRDYLTRAESLGFHSAWTQEAVLARSPKPTVLSHTGRKRVWFLLLRHQFHARPRPCASARGSHRAF